MVEKEADKMDSKNTENEIKENEKRKKHRKKLLIGIVVSVCFLSLAVVGGVQYYRYYLAPGWYEREEGLKYRVKGESGFAVGVQEIDGQLYCFDADGWLLYGWILYEDNIYYADENGVLARGALDLDGKICHFDSETGVLLVGWQEEEGVRRYFLEDGTYATGYREIDGVSYKFAEDGIPYIGMEETPNGTRLFMENGLAEGITSFEGKTYYFVDSYMQYGLCQIEDRWYYFAEDGVMQRGWQILDEKKYYFGEDGAKLTGTQTIEGVTYYLTEDGELLSGWVETEAGKYYYSYYGEKLTGTQTIEGETYYLTEDGKLISGWVETGDGKYYYSDHGAKLTGTQTIGGETYYLTEDGKLISGWVTAGGTKYYYSSHGQKLTGWQTIGNKRYYFQDDGAMAVNTTIGMYNIDGNGVASKILATPENLGSFLDEILNNYGRSPSAINNAVYSLISYKYCNEGSSIEQMACDAINNGKGACWNYSSLGYMLLQRAGYQVYYVRGTFLPKGNPHRWLYVKHDDGWFYMDCMHTDRVKLTDEQFANLRFDWDRSGLPGY